MSTEPRLRITGDDLGRLATGRDRDLFIDDVERNRDALRAQFEGRRILVLGGAGSIGSSTVAAISLLNPAVIHVIDHSENALAELIRGLRSRPEGLRVPEVRAMPLDLGSSLMRRFVAEQPPYDWILNFAALKHVRSEKDVCSILQMMETNLLKPARLWQWACERGPAPRYFSVSTDKAADPANLMGASKRLMEHTMFAADGVFTGAPRCTTARFANVAFSNGSLLESFSRRLQERQPLAAPRDTRRFFISLRESGQICMLAAAGCPDRHVLVPRLDAFDDARDLEHVARAFLGAHGLAPQIYTDEDAARASVSQDLLDGRYPLLLTSLDTEGEKVAETFVGVNETAVEIGMTNALAVRYEPVQAGALPAFLTSMERFIERSELPVGKQELVELVASVIPEFHHAAQRGRLDERM